MLIQLQNLTSFFRIHVVSCALSLIGLWTLLFVGMHIWTFFYEPFHFRGDHVWQCVWIEHMHSNWIVKENIISCIDSNTGHMAYVSMMMIDVIHNHPVMRCFANILIKSRQEQHAFGIRSGIIRYIIVHSFTQSVIVEEIMEIRYRSLGHSMRDKETLILTSFQCCGK